MSSISTCIFNMDFPDQELFLMRLSHTLQKRKLISLALNSKVSRIGSCTTKGWEVSTFQSDTTTQSYLVTTLDKSIKTVNVGINFLAKE